MRSGPKKIESYGYADCLPHPAYFEPSEGFARATKEFPLALVAPKSVKRLHSQLDEYANREPDGTQLREPLTITRKDAEARGLKPVTWCSFGAAGARRSLVRSSRTR